MLPKLGCSFSLIPEYDSYRNCYIFRIGNYQKLLVQFEIHTYMTLGESHAFKIS